MTNVDPKGALSGLRVIDLATVWAGPFATTLLADMGAEVIQVESLYRYPTGGKGQANPKKELVPRLGNLMRGYPDLDPGDDSWNRTSIFNAHARNKRNMTVDLTRDRGRELFLRLVDQSDALIENNPLGTLEKLGVGHEILLERNPRLVVVRMPPLGRDGPDAQVTGLGSQFEGFIGISEAQGYSDETNPVASLHMDAASGPAAASALLMGIIRRRRTGLGGLVEVPQAENLVNHHGETFTAAGMYEQDPERLGNRHHRWAPQGVYPTSDDDGWIALSVRNDAEWEALVELMGNPKWARTESLRHEAGRRQAHDLIDEHLARWTVEHGKYDLFNQLQQVGVPAGPVLTEADAYNDPHLRDRGFFVELTHPRAGTHDHPGRLFTMSVTPPELWRAAPVLGQDNRYVYQELLGVDDAEYLELEADGHIGDRYIFSK